MKGLRILLGDDHALMLAGIQTLLKPHCNVVGSATDGKQLVEAAVQLRPDMVIADVSMPRLNGLDAAKQIREVLPAVKLIFLSMHTNPMYLRKAIDTGAHGYVLKNGVSEELLTAIRQVLQGETFISPGFGPDVIEGLWNRSGQPSREFEQLTDRQREILQLIAEGRLSKEIAYLL